MTTTTTMGIILDRNHIPKNPIPIHIHTKNNDSSSLGCMAGFFNLAHLLSGKRFHPKPLPPINSPSSAEQQPATVPPTPPLPRPPPTSTPSPSPWKLSRDAPRLSLDSRFVVDAKGSLHPREPKGASLPTSPPGVIARLMGLEPHPAAKGGGGSGTNPDPQRKLQLRRSASESRSRDPLSPPYAFIDSKSFLSSPKIDEFDRSGEQTNRVWSTHAVNVAEKFTERMTRPVLQQRKSYYDTADFFPVQKRTDSISVSMDEEPSKDLESLKQMLEAIQLKGLLHSIPSEDQTGHRNFLYERHLSSDASPRRERSRIPAPALVKQTPEHRVGAPGRSARSADQGTSRSPRSRRSTVMRADDEASNAAESSKSTCSQTTDAERWRMEAIRDGRSLLERCDSLLNSIAEMTAKTAAASVTELQPSPVSVLDSSFRKEDEEESPSPVMKRTIDLKEEAEQVVELEDHEMMCSPSNSVFQLNEGSETSNLAYISEILQTSDYLLPDNHADIFLSAEEQQLLKDNGASRSWRIERRLIFDSISEMLDQNQQLPPWKAAASPVGNSFRLKPSLSLIWSELQGIKEPDPPNGLFDTISGVLKKDLSDDSTSGWGDIYFKMSDTVLDVERLIFKDLIGESIQILAISSWWNVAVATGAAPRRKLVF